MDNEKHPFFLLEYDPVAKGVIACWRYLQKNWLSAMPHDDGTVRDIWGLEKVGFPVFARVVQAEGTFKNTPGRVECPVRCGGLSVLPGDVVVGDENGVVVVSKDQAGAVLKTALDIQAREAEIRSRLSAGASLYDLFGIRAFFEEKNKSR